MNELITALVAGHMYDRLPEGEANERVFAAFHDILALLRDSAKEKGAELRVMTGVCEGADAAATRIAAALDLPLRLLAPGVPDSLDENQKRDAHPLWMGAEMRSGDDVPYGIRDESALAFADIALILWDGESPKGMVGGTVRMAFRAAQMMRPVVWIGMDGVVRVLDRSKLDAVKLHKLRSPEPDPGWLRDCFSAPMDMAALKQQFLVEIIPAIIDPSGFAGDGESRNRLRDYIGLLPQEKHSMAGHLHTAWMALLRGEVGKLAKLASPKIPTPDWGPVNDGSIVTGTPFIDSRFEFSDAAANLAAGRHRDMTWILYGSASLAVFAAVAGVIGLWPGKGNYFWAIAELMLLVLIVAGYRMAKSDHWHARWVANRFIAEQLRYLKMCLPILAIPKPFYEPAWKAENGKLKLASAELWLLQRTLTKEGLPERIISVGDDKKRYADYLKQVVEDQIEYHEGNHEKNHAVHHRLHGFSIFLFVATSLAVIAHFLIHAEWLLIFTACFPAFAAAIHGLATKLEISRIASQSESTKANLDSLMKSIEEVAWQPGWRDWLRLRFLALEAASAMSDENTQWQALILYQDTELPA